MLGRKLKNIFNNRKTLYMILSIMLVSVFTLSVAYAALNTVLNITGNAEVIASNWDIHLENVQVKSGSVGGVEPKITNATTATFSTKLTTPGDFYEFSIDVVNDGSIDAMIDSVTKTPTLTEQQAKYLNYIVEYENGNTISTKQLVKAESFVRLKVRVEYRKDLTSTDLPTTNDSLTLSFTVNYVQADNNGSSVLNNGTLKAMVKSGIGTDVGDEICIGEECFYVISSTDDTVTMLAKYNLLVGIKYDNVNGSVLLENPTGIQDETAIGWFSGYSVENPQIGLKLFSSTNYWSSTVSSYPAYVYNENSYLYEYVEYYRDYLEGLGTKVNEARLITMNELERLGCIRASISCGGAPSWVYSTTYWTGDASSSTHVWIAITDGSLGWGDTVNNGYGVRPVITISKNQILGIKNEVKPVANGSLDEVGTVVTIGTEQFYTIGTEGDNVKLLAKYNLLVGNKCIQGVDCFPLENPTGLQDESAKGWFAGYNENNPIIGAKPFSSTNYWSSIVSEYPSYVYNENSNIYEYVENYKRYLESFEISIHDARLITVEELENLGCSSEEGNCNSAPNWVYSTTYWTGDSNSSTHLWRVFSDLDFDYYRFSTTGGGTRPIIVIDKKQIISNKNS